jgi:hypothetical protein
MNAAPDILSARFHDDMLETYHLLSRQYGYRATYFLQMIEEHGGVETARRLIKSAQPGEGLTRLWELKRLDLSVEAYVLHAEYTPLFTEEERRIASERLKAYGYRPGP